MIRGDSMDIGLNLPPELETSINATVSAAVNKAVEDTKRANSYPPYMNQRQAAKYLGTSPATVIRWEKAGIGFPTITIEGSKHYSKAALDEWMTKQQAQQN